MCLNTGLQCECQKPLDIQNNLRNLCSDKCFCKICGLHCIGKIQPQGNTCKAYVLHYPCQRL